MNPYDVLDTTETLLAHLICADNDDAENNITGAKRGVSMDEIDAGAVLRFDTMRPGLAHTFDMLDGDRLFTMDHRELLAHPSEILGDEAEVAIFKESGHVQWTGFRRLRKPPRGVWIAGKASAIYELHWRNIYPSGRSTYFRRVTAAAASGAPIPCVIQGSNGSGNESVSLILAASIMEDVARTGCFTTTVQDGAGIVFPVPYGAQVELFKLRDGPVLPGGRKKAILHWVAKHLRQRGEKQFPVKEHTRGVHDFTVEGLRVRLDPNDDVSTVTGG